MQTLIDSLQLLIKQSTEALGADDPSTLMLKQQLAAAIEARAPRPRVFWMQSAQVQEADEPQRLTKPPPQ